jgi:hypothetical protein
MSQLRRGSRPALLGASLCVALALGACSDDADQTADVTRPVATRDIPKTPVIDRKPAIPRVERAKRHHVHHRSHTAAVRKARSNRAARAVVASLPARAVVAAPAPAPAPAPRVRQAPPRRPASTPSKPPASSGGNPTRAKPRPVVCNPRCP